METMTTLRISSQGQITIPKAWRKTLSLKPGRKILAWLQKGVKDHIISLQAEPKNWVDKVAGSGQGLWGDSDKYIQQERNSWSRK